MVENTVLPNGADVEFEDDRNTHSYDRIEITPSGWVMCIAKHSYQLDVYKQSEIKSMHTYTKHLEDKEWW